MSLENILKFIKKNAKYVAVGVIFFVAILFGYSGNNSVKESACGGPAKPGGLAVAVPEIGTRDRVYRLSNFLNAATGDYYRLTFSTKADQDSEIAVKLVSASGKETIISAFNAPEAVDFFSPEIIFKADGFYKDIVFEKKNENDSAKVNIRNARLSRLNIKSEQEAKLLRPVASGDVKVVESTLRQTEKSEKYFAQLKSGGTGVGQIFRAESEYLAGITLDLRKKGDSTGKYRLELREADEKDGDFSVSSAIAAVFEFSAGDIDGYKSKKGEIFFPLASRLEKGKMYFVGLDNSAVKNSFLNHLEIKGTADRNAFSGGAAVEWKDGVAEEIGDLFFIVHTAEFSEVQGARIPTGARIEDLGGGNGLYSYQTNRKSTDILDVSSYDRGNVRFNDYEGIISGSPKDDVNYVYKFSAPFAFEKTRIIAEQMYGEWYRVVIAYSFDNQNWMDLAYTGDGENDSPQKFDSIISGDGIKKDLYIRVSYDKFDNKEIKLFGLRNFSIMGELKVK